MLLLTAGIRSFTACVENHRDIESVITTIKKHNTFNIVIDLDLRIMAKFFKECG